MREERVPCPMDKGRRCARGEPGPDTSDAAKPKDKIHLLLCHNILYDHRNIREKVKETKTFILPSKSHRKIGLLTSFIIYIF